MASVSCLIRLWVSVINTYGLGNVGFLEVFSFANFGFSLCLIFSLFHVLILLRTCHLLLLCMGRVCIIYYFVGVGWGRRSYDVLLSHHLHILSLHSVILLHATQFHPRRLPPPWSAFIPPPPFNKRLVSSIPSIYASW